MGDIYIVSTSLLHVWSYSGSLFTEKGIAKVYVKIVLCDCCIVLSFIEYIPRCLYNCSLLHNKRIVVLAVPY